MKLFPKVGLLALVVVLGAFAFAAAPASAAFTCGAAASPCAVTMTSSDSRFVTAGGLATLSCADNTFSANVTDEAASASTTGASVTYTTCRINIDAGCTVTVTPTAADAWTLTLASSVPNGATSWDVNATIGEVRIVQRTCNIASNNGTITVTRGSTLRGCIRYTSTTGVLAISRCSVPYSVTGTLATILGRTGTASYSANNRTLIDATRKAPTIS